MSEQLLPHADPGDPEYYDDPAWVCDRCGEEYPVETGMEVWADFYPVGDHSWSFCEDCMDSFTAWRLSKDAPSVADQLAGEDRPFAG